jgi:hypothetical protein
MNISQRPLILSNQVEPFLRQLNRQSFLQLHFNFFNNFFSWLWFLCNTHIALQIFSCPIDCQKIVVRITYLVVDEFEDFLLVC